MLGKLMKYEWKATWKLLLSANALTLVMTGLARWMVYLMDKAPYSSDFEMVNFVAVMVLFTYVMSMFAVFVGTAIYLIYRFTPLPTAIRGTFCIHCRWMRIILLSPSCWSVFCG